MGKKTPRPRTQARTPFKTAPEAKPRTKGEWKERLPAKKAPKTSTKRTPERKEAPEAGLVRLQKIIAEAGVTSRRKAEELMLEGRVRVNGRVVDELGAKADPLKDKIEVDGRNISHKGPPTYILLNKPKGYISSVSDPLKRPVVVDLIKGGTRVFPVGRLDYDAEGVLLLTNDGDLANRLIHPKFDVPKKYLVKVKDVPTQEEIQKLEKGVYLEDGRTLPAKARFIRKTQENSWIELTVTEGRNRLVKRMCLAIGHPVAKLKRVEFAGIKLGSLNPGQYRLLTKKEVERLKTL